MFYLVNQDQHPISKHEE